MEIEKIKNELQKLDADVSLIIKEVGTDKSILINEEKIFPSASMIKLNILWSLYKKDSLGQIDLNDEVTIENDDIVGGFGIIKELHSGIKFTLRDLATLMIILSDNVATNKLIDILGIDYINKCSEELGLKNSILQRKMMDSYAKSQGKDNYTTGEDISKILEDFLDSQELKKEKTEEIIDILCRQQCNNKLPFYMAEQVKFAHKTGDLSLLEHDGGILFLDDKKIIIVVLTNNLNENKDGVDFINNIGKIIYEYYMGEKNEQN